MRFLTFILITIIPFYSLSQTNINGGAISNDTWTASNSPYLINGDISITGSLKIEPGTEVVFTGHYLISVYGVLKAEGTVNDSVFFRASDTTNWYNDAIPAGGWKGIYINNATINQDSTGFNYCSFKDVKYGATTYNGYNIAINAFYRGISIKNSTFEHCRSTGNSSTGYLIQIAADDTDSSFIENCVIKNCEVRVAVLRINPIDPDAHISISNSSLNNIEGGNVISVISYGSALIEGNEIFENSISNSNECISLLGNDIVFRKNNIHHNTSEDHAVVHCKGGNVLVDQNLISNNFADETNCGLAEGGGGIRLGKDIASNNFNPMMYIVRNNVISNNHSNFSGTGIYVFEANAQIYNNSVINNFSVMKGPGLQVWNNNSNVDVYNNIFYGNQSQNYGAQEQINVVESNTFNFNYNYLPYSVNQSIDFTNYTFSGDSSNCIISNDPGLVNITNTSTYTEDATNMDYNLNPNSVCVNQGDQSLGATSFGNLDFYNQTRVIGSSIDIGAVESTVNDEEPSGIDQHQFEFSVFPNPASNKLNVFSSKGLSGTIKLISLNGQVVYSSHIPENTDFTTISVESIDPGIYLLYFHDSLNQKRHSKKIIVE